MIFYASRKFEDLHPYVAKLAKAFVTECEAQGCPVLITSTYRSAASQDALYAQGRSLPGKKVTNAKGGYSWHCWHCAFDFVPISHGKCQWTDIDAFFKCGKIAEEIGLEWAGRWTKFPELCHCQFTGGLSLADFREGKTLPSKFKVI